jgi:hypothetical protein
MARLRQMTSVLRSVLAYAHRREARDHSERRATATARADVKEEAEVISRILVHVGGQRP